MTNRFAEYVNGKRNEDVYIMQLEEEVRKAKMNPLWRKEFMDLREKLYLEREEGIKVGRKEGLARGKTVRNQELILSLHKKNKSDEEIADLLDLDVLEIKTVLAENHETDAPSF